MKPAVLLYWLLSFVLSVSSLPSHCMCGMQLSHLITLSDTHTTVPSLGLPWTRDRPVAELYARHIQNLHKSSTLAAGFEPAVTASDWPQIHVRSPGSPMLITKPCRSWALRRCLDDANLLSNSEIHLSTWTILWTLAKSRDQILAERNCYYYYYYYYYSIKSSRADSRVKVWKFSKVSGTDCVPVLQGDVDGW